MVKPAIQLYTLRDVDRPLPEILELVADAGFEGVEFAFRVRDADLDPVVETLDETGLDVAGAHVGIDALEADFEETVSFYRNLGCTDFVVPSLDAEYFESREGVQRAAARLGELQEDLDDRDLTLHYHNHDHEFVDLDGTTGFDAFVDATTVGIELDVGFGLRVGDDPVERLRSLGERTRLIHLKDVALESGESVPVGEGDLDPDALAAEARDRDWLIYEYEGEDPIGSLDDAGETVRDLC